MLHISLSTLKQVTLTAIYLFFFFFFNMKCYSYMLGHIRPVVLNLAAMAPRGGGGVGPWNTFRVAMGQYEN